MEQARSKEIDLFGDALRFDALDCALRESDLLTQQIRQAVGASSFNESPIKAFTLDEVAKRLAQLKAQFVAAFQSFITRLDDEPSLLNTYQLTAIQNATNSILFRHKLKDRTALIDSIGGIKPF